MERQVELVVLSSDDENERSRKHSVGPMIMRRGPMIEGRDTFDLHCVWPNKVALRRNQVQFLKEVVAKKKPTIPLYVCTMKPANVDKPRAKMYFTRKFTSAFIKKNLRLPVDIKVYCNKKVCGKVRIIMEKGKGKGAQITTNWWNNVVEKTEMLNVDIFLFWFRRSVSEGLKLVVHEVVSLV